MALIRCSICRREFDPQLSKALPFCSERCRKIDLHRWLNEEIALPADDADEDVSPPPAHPSDN